MPFICDNFIDFRFFPGDGPSALNRNHSTNGIFMQRQNAFDKTHSAVTRTQSAPGDANTPKDRKRIQLIPSISVVKA